MKRMILLGVTGAAIALTASALLSAYTTKSVDLLVSQNALNGSLSPVAQKVSALAHETQRIALVIGFVFGSITTWLVIYGARSDARH